MKILVLGLLGFVMVVFSDTAPIRYQSMAITYSGLHVTTSPNSTSVDKDLKIISEHGFVAVRTYYPQYRGGKISLMPKIANNGLKVLLGLYIFPTPHEQDWTESDYQRDVKPFLNDHHLLGILVGNEDYLTHIVAIRKFIEQIKKEAPGVPVSSAQTVNFWLNSDNNPEIAALINRCDYIAVNIYPNWDWQHPSARNQPLTKTMPQQPMTSEQGFQSFLKQYQLLYEKYPHKQIVVTETGWPTTYGLVSAGQLSIKQYQIGLDNASDYSKKVQQWSRDHHITVFLYAMFDDRYAVPKISAFNYHFGVLNSNGTAKIVVCN